MDDLEQIIADQMEEIERLSSESSEYWEGVYDRILDAWEAFALAELGTRTPSALDLQGRPELLALYEAVK